MFRDVLSIELGELGQGVRAKRGPKLPVVLTVAEVAEVLGNLQGTAMIYTHVVKNMRAPAVSPLDAMRRAG